MSRHALIHLESQKLGSNELSHAGAVWTKCSFPNSRGLQSAIPCCQANGGQGSLGTGFESWISSTLDRARRKNDLESTKYSVPLPSCVERTRSGSHANLRLRLRLNVSYFHTPQ